MASVKEMQLALNAAGYDCGTADGICGSKTVAAVMALINDSGHGGSGGDDFESKYPHFTRSEFACKCGCGYEDIQDGIMQLLVNIREHFNAPVIVSSGCRCAEHNAAVGGVYNSYHLSGRAADICVSGHTATEVKEYAQTLSPHYTYCIDSNYLHIDI